MEYPRLLFFCNRVMPLTFASIAMYLGAYNYINPPTPEQLAEIETRRRTTKDGRFNEPKSEEVKAENEKSDLEVFFKPPPSDKDDTQP